MSPQKIKKQKYSSTITKLVATIVGGVTLWGGEERYEWGKTTRITLSITCEAQCIEG